MSSLFIFNLTFAPFACFAVKNLFIEERFFPTSLNLGIAFESTMAKTSKTTKLTLPIIVEKDEDGFYVVECPLLKGCYTQGETLDEALKNIREVIEMCLEEESEDEVSDIAHIQEFSFHTVAVEV